VACTLLASSPGLADGKYPSDQTEKENPYVLQPSVSPEPDTWLPKLRADNEKSYAELFGWVNKALLTLDDGANTVEAEACFLKAIDVAQSQNAKSWELRAASDLARLWRDQGKSDDARDLLKPVFVWFTEGFETADLKDAKVLLDDLA